ncbi:MAG: DUF3592 domain-containing protein [Gammaproteobacteria bacterium]|nr:DUF3592 domain-containing protein [Gammaproteobacteria bacterium]
MLQLIFSTLSAFNQVAAFAGALVFCGLGTLLVGDALYWRLHAVRVQGEVIGVRRNGNSLNSVYRYTSAAGATLEATSLEGSSSVHGRETGRLVPLWVIPEKPNEVQEAGNHVFTVVGIALLAVGMALFWFAATAWRTSPMTWVVAGLFVLQLSRRLRSIIAPRDKTLPASRWRALATVRSNADPRDSAPSQRVEELMALPEFRDRQAQQRAQLARLAPFLVLLGLAVLALGVYQSRTLLKLEATGIRTAGRVTALSPSTDSDGGVTYHPLVCYIDADGQTVVFRDSTGSNPPLYHVGQAVTVLYPADHTPGAIIDQGVWNWLPAGMLYLFGTLLFAAGIAGWRGGASDAPLPAQG